MGPQTPSDPNFGFFHKLSRFPFEQRKLGLDSSGARSTNVWEALTEGSESCAQD